MVTFKFHSIRSHFELLRIYTQRRHNDLEGKDKVFFFFCFFFFHLGR